MLVHNLRQLCAGFLLLCAAPCAAFGSPTNHCDHRDPICETKPAGAGILLAQAQPKLLDWRETARLEHDDRKLRFARLAREGKIPTPLFLESQVDATRLPGLRAHLPVLRLVYPDAVFFDTGSHELKAAMQATIAAFASAMRGDVPDAAVFVVGHTDARGSDDYNYRLSVNRAESVSRELYRLGIGQTRLWRMGFGEAVPIAPNDSPANMSRNRRVEFIFAAKAEAVALWLSQQSVNICDGLPPPFRLDCQRRVTELPPVRAEPVVNAHRIEAEALGSRTIARVETGRDLIAPVATRPSIVQAPASKSETEAAPSRDIVTIDRLSPVIIDLREQRVIVGAPIL